MKVTLENEQIRVQFGYDPEHVQRIKEIPYRRYDPETKTWLIPQAQWRTLKEKFNDVPIEVPEEHADQTLLLESNHLITSISQIEGFKGKLYPFQAEGAGFLVTRRRCLLSDQMGLGKTLMAIAAALKLRNRGEIQRCLVFCPKTIIMQWVQEYYRFTREGAVAIIGNKEQRKLAYKLCSTKFFSVTNYETVLQDADLLASLEPDLVILDEAQRIKSYKAKTTRLIKKHFKPPYRWCLTGTPLENRLGELHSIMEWVDPGILGPWWKFRKEYLIYGGYKRKEIIGHRNLDHLHDQISLWMLRRRKKDVLHQLPSATVNNYYVELSREERRIYNMIRKRLEEYYSLYRHGKRKSSSDVLAQLVFLRECCDHPALVEVPVTGSSKLDELHRIIQDLGEEKIVVFTEFERFLRIIADTLKTDLKVDCAELHGALNQKQRIKAIEKFNKNRDCQVFLSTEAGGLGVNLQVASILVNLDLHWNPARLQQRIGRLHRIGQKSTVTCINLVAQDTIEERVLKVIRDKTSLFQRVIDGDFNSPAYERRVWQILDEEFSGRRRT